MNETKVSWKKYSFDERNVREFAVKLEAIYNSIVKASKFLNSVNDVLEDVGTIKNDIEIEKATDKFHEAIALLNVAESMLNSLLIDIEYYMKAKGWKVI